MRDRSSYLDAHGHIIFGEWWRIDAHLISALRVEDSSYRLLKCLQVACDWSPHEISKPPRHAEEALSTSFDQNFDDHEWNATEVHALQSTILNQIQTAKSTVGADLNDFGAAITERWAPSSGGADEVCETLLASLSVSINNEVGGLLGLTEARTAPTQIADRVDLAMFPALPSYIRPQIWLAAGMDQQFDSDPLIGLKLSLATCHEAVGHMLQHRLRVIGNTLGRVLDRELMEGWGVVCEDAFSRFGALEQAAVVLYRLKRLIPAVRLLLDQRSWSTLRTDLIDCWPEFVLTDDFLLFRRCSRRHAMGFARMFRAGIRTIDDAMPSNTPLNLTPWHYTT